MYTLLCLIPIHFLTLFTFYIQAFVPEWSKGAVSRTAIARCVGSNPTGCILLSPPYILSIILLSYYPYYLSFLSYISHFFYLYYYLRGCSSFGRAFASHAKGKGIDTPHLHYYLDILYYFYLYIYISIYLYIFICLYGYIFISLYLYIFISLSFYVYLYLFYYLYYSLCLYLYMTT
ncbi:hypothetical protein EIN_256760 [Entamoeba invadens IP1]|uniref:Uncharacterized protein n=1 Tax=Entamoeba invadens IP1 TaxID=370355 RepID=L7FKY9_ENTIV|nr:hypothetical protein EIN_256760 [Entamoeba invadens IP1]ELP85994.1 hypothetical protein EIN_256760 [Entamoeba invadens IP1]|eukprot:XP_004185340.1 hypothetical protein EIN_256760 [Entamoeba invadens IP1]